MNYKIGQTIYTVQGCRIGKGIIKEIITRNDGKNESVSYTIQPVTREKQAIVKACFVVNNLEDAKLSALKNLETIYINTLKDLKNITIESFKIEKK